MRRVRFVDNGGDDRDGVEPNDRGVEPNDSSTNLGGVYRTREHLYYQPPPTLTTTDQQGQSSQPTIIPTTTTTNTNINADDMRPPIGSLYDMTNLSPQHQQQHQQQQRGIQQQIPLAMGTATPIKAAAKTIDEEDDLDHQDGWITIFGFPPGATEAIVEHFRGIGEVAEWKEEGSGSHPSSFGGGNWVHLCYTSNWSAQRALLKNGTVIPWLGSCMIGVVRTRQVLPNITSAAQGSLSPVRATAFASPTSPILPSSATLALSPTSPSATLATSPSPSLALSAPHKFTYSTKTPQTPLKNVLLAGDFRQPPATGNAPIPATPSTTNPNPTAPTNPQQGVMHRLASFVLNL